MFKTLKDKFNRLGDKLSQKLPLHRLSDKNLRIVTKTSQVLAALAVGHAGLWLGVGVIGGIALGLHAAGLAVPAVAGAGSLIVGGLLAAKSIVFGGFFSALYKACTATQEKRQAKTASAAAAAPAPASGGKVASTPPLAPNFAPAAAPAPQTPASPEVKPVVTPPPPKP